MTNAPISGFERDRCYMLIDMLTIKYDFYKFGAKHRVSTKIDQQMYVNILIYRINYFGWFEID